MYSKVFFNLNFIFCECCALDMMKSQHFAFFSIIRLWKRLDEVFRDYISLTSETSSDTSSRCCTHTPTLGLGTYSRVKMIALHAKNKGADQPARGPPYPCSFIGAFHATRSL